jgi:hypothetical protein
MPLIALRSRLARCRFTSTRVIDFNARLVGTTDFRSLARRQQFLSNPWLSAQRSWPSLVKIWQQQYLVPNLVWIKDSTGRKRRDLALASWGALPDSQNLWQVSRYYWYRGHLVPFCRLHSVLRDLVHCQTMSLSPSLSSKCFRSNVPPCVKYFIRSVPKIYDAFNFLNIMFDHLSYLFFLQIIK